MTVAVAVGLLELHFGQHTCQGMILGQWYFAFHCSVGLIFYLSSRRTFVCKFTDLRNPTRHAFAKRFTFIV